MDKGEDKEGETSVTNYEKGGTDPRVQHWEIQYARICQGHDANTFTWLKLPNPQSFSPLRREKKSRPQLFKPVSWRRWGEGVAMWCAFCSRVIWQLHPPSFASLCWAKHTHGKRCLVCEGGGNLIHKSENTSKQLGVNRSLIMLLAWSWLAVKRLRNTLIQLCWGKNWGKNALCHIWLYITSKRPNQKI